MRNFAIVNITPHLVFWVWCSELPIQISAPSILEDKLSCMLVMVTELTFCSADKSTLHQGLIEKTSLQHPGPPLQPLTALEADTENKAQHCCVGFQRATSCRGSTKVKQRDLMNIGLVCLNESKLDSNSCTFRGTIHLHFTQGEGLPIPWDYNIHKAPLHAASITVVSVGFTRYDVEDGGTPDSGGSRGNIYLVDFLFQKFFRNRSQSIVLDYLAASSK